MTAPTLLTAALDYAGKGWSIFPVKPRGKTPLTAHGLEDATSDITTIRNWWSKWPDANIGYAVGKGVVVVDIDDVGSWTDLLEDANQPVPDTSRVATCSGWHLFFATDTPIRNSVGKLRPGLDVRGDGGYVVLPPSVHESGHVYAWEKNGTPDELPAWLRKLLTSKPAPRPTYQPDRSPPFYGDSSYGRRSLEAEAATVSGAIEGTRRDRLNTAAFNLGQLVAGGELEEGDVRAELRAAALSTGLPEAEVETTIDNGIADGKLSPRTAPQQSSSPVLPIAAERAQRPRRRGRLTLTPLSEIEMRSIEWLERPLWQKSAFQLLSGPKGSGKGTYLAGLAARLTRQQVNVLFVSTEDSAEIDLKPRLVAAGVDQRYCSLIRQHVQLPDDVDELRALAEEVGNVGLFVIDPVANHIGNKNSNNDVEVRHAIAPLNGLADELGCLLIGVRHPGKDRSRGAVASILGSTAWVDTPRAVVMIAQDDEDPVVRHIQVVVGNRSLNGAGEAFRIDAVNVPGLTEPITLAVALGESAKSVDDLLAADPTKNSPRVVPEQLQELILRELETGEKSRDYLDAVAKDELGANPDTVYKSGLVPLRQSEQVKARKAGMNDGWYWTRIEART